jgi:tetratricopeptide (TPR) repeat protein
MRAEHRKELQTNILADRMGRLVQGMKSGPQANSAAVWFLGLLALGTLVAWYYTGKTQAGRSALWVELDGNTNVRQLVNLADTEAGTFPGRMARFQAARLLLQQGLQGLYSENRTQELKNIQEAGKSFEALAAECDDDPLLAQDALLGAAKAEETRGHFDRALDFYVKAVQRNLQVLGKRSSPDNALASYNDVLKESLQRVRQRLVTQVDDLKTDDEKRNQLQTIFLVLVDAGASLEPWSKRLADKSVTVADLEKDLSAAYDDLLTRPEQTLKLFQKLAANFPSAFDDKAAAIRDQTYRGRSAALRAHELQDHRQDIEDLYAELDKFARGKDKKDTGAP